MEKIDISSDYFYKELEKLKLYYQNLSNYEIVSGLEEKSLENIQTINALTENFKEDQQKGIIDADERRETLYMEMKELLETYKEAGKEEQLDFTEEELSELMEESKIEDEEESIDEIGEIEVVKIPDTNII